MVRNPFRRQKADGTLDDGTATEGYTTPYDSSSGFGLMDDNPAIYNLTITTPLGTNQGTTSASFQTVHNTPRGFPFISPKSGNLSKLSVKIHTGQASEVAMDVGIYNSDSDGYLHSLVGIARFPSQTTTANAIISQTSFRTSNTDATAITITLVKGQKYWIFMPLVAAGAGFKLMGQAQGNRIATGKGTLGGSGYNGHMWYYGGNSGTYGCPPLETDLGWVTKSSNTDPIVWVSF